MSDVLWREKVIKLPALGQLLISASALLLLFSLICITFHSKHDFNINAITNQVQEQSDSKVTVKTNAILKAFDSKKQAADAMVFDGFLSHQWVTSLKKIISDHSFAGLLMSLDEQLPVQAKTIRYIGLLQEINQINQRLDSLLKTTEKNNQYLGEFIEIAKKNRTRGGR